MYIRSLLLGSIAAVALATSGFAIDLNQATPTDVCLAPALSAVDGDCSGMSLTFNLDSFLVTDPIGYDGAIELTALNDFGDPNDLLDGEFIGIGDTSAGFSKEPPAMFLPEWDIFAVGVDMVAMNPDEVGLGASARPGGGLGEDLWVKDQTWFDLFGKKPVIPNDATLLTAPAFG